MGTLEQRHAIRHDRMQALRDSRAIPMVRVLPRDEGIRKHIAHMPGNIRFPKEGSAKWPFDTFTKRRLRDGDVTLVEEAEALLRLADESPSPEGGEV